LIYLWKREYTNFTESMFSDSDFVAHFFASILEHPRLFQRDKYSTNLNENEIIATHIAKQVDLWSAKLNEVTKSDNNLVAYLSISLCNVAVETIQTSMIVVNTPAVQENATALANLLTEEVFLSIRLNLKWVLAVCSQWSQTIRSLYRFSDLESDTDVNSSPILGASDSDRNPVGDSATSSTDGSLSHSFPHPDWTRDPNCAPEAILHRVETALASLQALNTATRRGLVGEAEEAAIEDILVNCSYMFSSEQRELLLACVKQLRSANASADADTSATGISASAGASAGAATAAQEAAKSDSGSEVDTTIPDSG
jgi:hypothetical protein